MREETQKQMIFKDLLGELASEDIKFLYWCWENKKYLNEERLSVRPGKALHHLDASGTIRSQILFPIKNPYVENSTNKTIDRIIITRIIH